MIMNNYFANQRIHWSRWSPEDIYFKRNILVKKANAHNEVNVISYNSKGAFQEEYDKGVFIHVKDIKSEFPTAHINLWNKLPAKDCQWTNNLAYLTSRHYSFEWVKDPTTPYGWANKKVNQTPLPDYEGYRFDLGGTASLGTPQQMQEQIDILNAIHRFFMERILPAKRGTLATNPLTMAA